VIFASTTFSERLETNKRDAASIEHVVVVVVVEMATGVIPKKSLFFQ